MADLPGCVYINGEFVQPSDAKLSVFDVGFISGVMVFDVMAGWQGWIFKLDPHIDRFYRSTHAVGLEMPYTKAEFRELFIETYRRGGLRDAFIECIATPGDYSPGSVYDWKTSVIIFSVPYRWNVPPAKIEAGARVMFARTPNVSFRNVDPKIKNSNRLHSYLAGRECYDAGADSVIMLDLDGRVTEGRGENVFAVRDGRLYSPSEGILQGVSREAVLEIAEDNGIEARLGEMTPYDFYTADEAFFCTTAGGIMPIVEIDGRRVGAGRPGELTLRIKDIYWQRHVSEPWATPVLG